MNISTITKYIDQPVVLHGLQKKMPVLLIGGGAAFAAYDTFKHAKGDEKQKKQLLLKNSIITAATLASLVLGTRGLTVNGKKIFKGLMENGPLEDILKKQSKAISHFIEETGLSDKKLINTLNKAKTGKLSLKDIDELAKGLPQNHARDELFQNITGEPVKHVKNHSCCSHHHEHSAKGHDNHRHEHAEHSNHSGCNHNHEDFKTIWRLSALGLIPVAGGVLGGIAADKITRTGSKESTANKVKEGFFQFLANIALCNVGAAIALAAAKQLEKRGVIKPLNRLSKMAVTLTGIVSTGILGGSLIANYLGKKVVNPIFDQQDKSSNIYSERKPETLDVALHIDDVSSAGVISGLKWIEPVIPLFYFISGYRAGVGYRNVNKPPAQKPDNAFPFIHTHFKNLLVSN
ncbi:MAG: hypothetical protein LBK53_03195 [Heliobacteriaceae bacterium]|nr:hypothetical protein [Heliobacteriaceae bacterium]